MNTNDADSNFIPQRWEGPLDFPPGFWKRQLATKYREIAARGDLASLQQLLAEHPEFLNKRGSHRRTFLWEAAYRGRLATVKWLVEHGAAVDATGAVNGESYVQLTPYCAAVYYRRKEVAAYLQTQGTKQDIFRAAFLGNQEQVARELDAQPELLNAEDPQDDLYYVPLIAFPIVGGHAALLEFLLRRGAEVRQYSAQLLYLAARDARMDLVELLVKYGAEISLMDSGTYVTLSDMAMMRYLLEHGAPTNRPGKNNFPPLVFLARPDKGEHPEKIQLLLDYGASVDAVGPKGRTALHLAASVGFLKVMKLLLDHGANIALRDHEGATALTLARAAGKHEAVKLLEQHSARR